MMKIIVDSDELKQQIINESEYINDFSLISETFKNNMLDLDPRKTELLKNIFKNPDIIEIQNEQNNCFRRIK